MVIFLTTPASTAYYNIYSSTAAALSSLLRFSSFISFFKLLINNGVCVNVYHDCAEVA